MAAHLSSEQRRAQIITSAQSVIEDVGIYAATMSAIAQRAGITRMWLYQFFPDVESVLAAVWTSWQAVGPDGRPFVSPVGEFDMQPYLRSCIDMWLDMQLVRPLLATTE